MCSVYASLLDLNPHSLQGKVLCVEKFSVVVVVMVKVLGKCMIA